MLALQKKGEIMNRREFLKLLGIGTGAVAAGAVAVPEKKIPEPPDAAGPEWLDGLAEDQIKWIYGAER